MQKFHKREGHCRVEQRHQEDGLKLGLWVSNQRSREDSLTPDQLKRLKSLIFSWDPHVELWEQNFTALQKFHKREGHCRVVRGHKEDRLNLGNWVKMQRTAKDTDMLSPERIVRLDQLGFSWDPHAELWERNFAALQKFRKREGHCRVPIKHQEDGLKLGQWVSNQRSNKHTLPANRLKRLNALCFVWKT